MIRYYSQEETLRIVRRLDGGTLETLVRQRVVVPTQSEKGAVFSQADIARMELLCDLTEGFDLDEDLLALLMSLIDQLHAARSDLRRLSQAVDVEAAEVRQRILARMTSSD
jgi:chaperone modulatory protein CbpM